MAQRIRLGPIATEEADAFAATIDDTIVATNDWPDVSRTTST